MRQKSGRAKEPAEKVVKDIRGATRRRFSAEDKIRIVFGLLPRLVEVDPENRTAVIGGIRPI